MLRLSGLARLLPALLLTGLVALSGCGHDEAAPPQTFAPLTYAYLKPLRVNVGSIEVTDTWAPGPGDLSAQSPVTPLAALHQMAQDRLIAAGASGRAVFTVEQASILQQGDMLNGLLKVRVDIFTSDGNRAAFAEAAVARSASTPEQDDGMPAALYAFTRQMMNDMNVELEFQLRRSLGDWVQAGGGPAPPPPPVQQQSLAPPAQPDHFRLVPVKPGQ